MAPNVISPTVCATLPKSKDLNGLFVPSMRGPIKSAFKAVMGAPTLTMINMAGGVPHPNSFPIVHLQAKVKSARTQSATDTLVLEKSNGPGNQSASEGLKELLQYGDGCGQDSYCDFLHKHTQRVHNPPYADWGVIASCGNTDSIGKAVSLFCQRGDSILVERWTFPGTLGMLSLAGVKPVAVQLDQEGMVPEDLDNVCSTWTGESPLRAVYLVPTGQNPTGATMSLSRRRAIYAVAQKHNLVIIEDDPYYFLQLPAYSPNDSASIGGLSNGQSPQTLVPSLLSLDVDGRVIRLDSFSKILAPNLRCGWITAPRYILDKLQILNESTTLQPSGLSQGVISKLLNSTWGMSGWEAHLQGLRTEYTMRRNRFVDMVEKHLKGLVEYTVPCAGMFLWMKINFGQAALDKSAMPRLLENMKKCGVMMAPGMPFSCTGPSPTDHYLRAAFALVEVEMFEPALARLAQAITAISGPLNSDTAGPAAGSAIGERVQMVALTRAGSRTTAINSQS
ncbi:hypothetical protein GGI07_004766 [Coemansia sp. Benny D115]|nr:hypothetical protein GGI07_004766 [Coemansia sp. Benny D115]